MHPASTLPQAGTHSHLWGANGEAFRPDGRLPDVSYAGYNAGETDLPVLHPTHNVRSFGAVGDGRTDDTPAFLAALAAMEPSGGVLHVPAGRYILTQRLQIERKISIKGDGSAYTVLVMPYSLADVYGDGQQHKGLKNWVPCAVVGEKARGGKPCYYSFKHGFLNWCGNGLTGNPRLKLADVTRAARRGDTCLTLSSTAGCVPGEWVSVTCAACSATGFLHLNLGTDAGGTDAYCTNEEAYIFQSRVAEVGPDGHTLVLERPLPWDLHTAPWTVYKWAPRLSNVGLEGVGFEFLSPQYAGHLKEPGWNAVEFSRCANVWVRDVRVHNADYGVNLDRCAFVTVTGVTATASADRASPRDKGATGHHALNALFSVDCLFEHFDIQTKFVHDLCVDKFSRGVVFAHGRGHDLCMDNHRGQTYACLFTCLHLGLGTRPWASGGDKARGLHAGTYTTWWGLVAHPPVLPAPPVDFGPGLNFVGVPAAWPPLDGRVSRTWCVEGIAPAALQPTNLHAAQRALRLAHSGAVCPLLGGRGRGGKRLDQY